MTKSRADMVGGRGGVGRGFGKPIFLGSGRDPPSPPPLGEALWIKDVPRISQMFLCIFHGLLKLNTSTFLRFLLLVVLIIEYLFQPYQIS